MIFVFSWFQTIPRVFSSGLDIMEMCGKSTERYAEFWRAVQEMWLRLYGSNMVTVAAVNASPLYLLSWLLCVLCCLLCNVVVCAGTAPKPVLSLLRQIQCWDVQVCCTGVWECLGVGGIAVSR